MYEHDTEEITHKSGLAEYFGIEMNELYKEYKLYWPILVVTSLLMYMVFYNI